MKIQIDQSRFTFDKTAKTITFLDYTTLELCEILFIANATAGVTIYDFTKATHNGTVSGNVLTLTYDTTSMNNADSLLVFINDPAFDQKTIIPKDNVAAMNVRGVAQKVDRIGFVKTISNNVDTEFLNIIGSTGTGQTVNQTGGNLVITTGTTVRSETIIRSINSWEGGIRLRAKVTLSQRIANTQTFVELVDVIGDGLAYSIGSATAITVTFPSGHGFTAENVGQSMYLGGFAGTGTFLSGRYPIASVSGDNITFTVSAFAVGTGTVSAFGWNYYQLQYQGASATAVNFDTQRKGWANGVTAASINTTASGHLATVTGNDLNATFSDQVLTSVAGTIQQSTRATRNENVPDDVPLRLQIRVLNLDTAPASTTTLTIGMLSVSNYSATDVSIQDVRQIAPQSALPVDITRSAFLFVTAAQGTGTTSNWGAAPYIATTANTGDTGAKTASFNGATVTNTFYKGVQLVLKVGAVTGTSPTLVAKIQGSSDGGTTWYDIPGATTATLIATGNYGITIYPGIKEVAGVATDGTTAQVDAVIPRNFRGVFTIGGTTPSFTLTNFHFTYLP